MFGWIAGLMIRRGVRRLNAGDVGPMLGSYAANAVLVFPGDHSWGGEYRGKARIAEFLQRCVDLAIKFQIEDVVVKGWPWSSTIYVRLTNEARSPEGLVVYSNRAIIFAKTGWGKIRYQEDYEDTQKVVEFDRYLASREALVV